MTENSLEQQTGAQSLPQRLAERLFSLRQAGIIDPSWIAMRVHERAAHAIAQEHGDRLRANPGLNKRIGRFLKRLVRKPKSAADEASGFAKDLETLLRDRRVSKKDGFTRRFQQLADSRAKTVSVRRALEKTWLDGLDLPLDALEDQRFQDLLAASLYRFSYGRDRSVNFFSELKASESGGVYLAYLKDTGSGLLERRLLAHRLSGSGLGRTSAIRAVELSRENGKLIVRGGVVVPNEGHDAFVLSGSVDLDECRNWLSYWAREGQPLFEIGESDVETGSSFLQSHRLGFITLRQRTPGEVVGAFVDGERFGQITGRRLEPGELDQALVASVGRLDAEDKDGLSVHDRNLIAAMPRYSQPDAMNPFTATDETISDQSQAGRN